MSQEITFCGLPDNLWVYVWFSNIMGCICQFEENKSGINLLNFKAKSFLYGVKRVNADFIMTKFCNLKIYRKKLIV